MSLNNQNAAEIRATRESTESFKSSVFKLQVGEVLNEITVDEKYASQARKLLFSIREVIANTAHVAPKPIDKIQSQLATRIPWPLGTLNDINNVKTVFGYTPPNEDDINVIGSWSLHTAIRKPHRPTGIDLFVGMPTEMFDLKDYRDFRYHNKKAVYLAYLASQIADSKLPVDVRFERFNNNPYRLGLVLTPTSSSYSRLGRKLNFHIHAGPAQPVFPENKLRLGKNAIRQLDGPTPVYNWSVLADQNTTNLLKLLHLAAAKTPAFCDAVKMGALWLEQHHYSSNRERGGGFGSFEFALLMATLLQPPFKLLAGHSSYQLFKGTLLYLAESDFIGIGVTTGSTGGTTTTTKLDSPGLVFNDSLDILANMAPWAYKSLHDDAVIACDLLNDNVRDRFDELFLRDVGVPKLAFDYNLTILFANETLQNVCVDKCYQILTKAWGERVRNMRILVNDNNDTDDSTWSMASDTPSYTINELKVHVNVRPELCEKKLSFLGPEFESKEDFKNFWGSKASLRRFQNGEIKDAVAWSSSSGKHSKSIIEESCQYAVDRHLDGVVEFSNDTNIGRHLLPAVAGNNGFAPIITSFQKLSNVLQELRNAVPLKIYSVMGTSPILRYTSVHIPQPFEDSTKIDAMIVLENSGKWPKDPEASAKVKVAFVVKIAETLRELHPEYFAVVSLEPELENHRIETAVLTVQTPEGYYFKLHLTNFTAQQNPLFAHSQAIANLALRFPLYSISVRLFKLWLDNQMLIPYLSEPSIELIVMNIFANSGPWSPPGSTSSAFWRSIELLARWNWQTDSLFVDLSPDNAKSEGATGCNTDISLYQSAVTATNLVRKQDPAFTQAPWLIATNLDIQGHQFTAWEPRSRIAALVASRITALSHLALKSNVSMKSMFKASTSDFDIVWKVKDPLSHEKRFKNIAISDPARAITSATNFAQDIVKALKTAYKDSLILFYDQTLTDTDHFVLCGLWNRANMNTVSRLKPGLSYPVKESKDGYVMDQEAILAELERLSGGILTRVK